VVSNNIMNVGSSNQFTQQCQCFRTFKKCFCEITSLQVNYISKKNKMLYFAKIASIQKFNKLLFISTIGSQMDIGYSNDRRLNHLPLTVIFANLKSNRLMYNKSGQFTFITLLNNHFHLVSINIHTGLYFSENLGLLLS
jgi:hypothetical protein